MHPSSIFGIVVGIMLSQKNINSTLKIIFAIIFLIICAADYYIEFYSNKSLLLYTRSLIILFGLVALIIMFIKRERQTK